MAGKFEKKAEQIQLDEAARLRASAQEHIEALKSFWSTFAITGVAMIAIVAFIIRGGLGWFVSNTQVGGSSAGISAAGQADFALATVGSKPQGVYDNTFGLFGDLTSETIDGTKYYIASANSSFRLDSTKNFNNYLADADLRPGNRGSFDLYVICRTEKRDLVLTPVFSAWCGEPDTKEFMYAFSEDANSDVKTAAEFLKGHILLFANMDDKGMYSGNIDYTKEITVDLSKLEATQDGRTFSWGKQTDSEGSTVVYCLPVYWVWPEQFGNFIYTGNSYNKNLFSSKGDEGSDYWNFIHAMEDEYQKFFCIKGNPERPKIETIFDESDYQTATKNYELYSDWYNAADEEIGTNISYIELGFEIAQEN